MRRYKPYIIDTYFRSNSVALGDKYGLLLEYTMALEVPNTSMAQVVIPYFGFYNTTFP